MNIDNLRQIKLFMTILCKHKITNLKYHVHVNSINLIRILANAGSIGTGAFLDRFQGYALLLVTLKTIQIFFFATLA